MKWRLEYVSIRPDDAARGEAGFGPTYLTH